MMEVLFIFGLIGWLLGLAWEYLTSLAAFPTIAVALLAVPLLTLTSYHSMIHRYDLEGVNQNRAPVPPERFYWSIYKRPLGQQVFAWVPVMLVAWYFAIVQPADDTLTTHSAVGWAAGLAAIVSTAQLLAASTVYVRASHWFDRMAPWAVGVSRQALYRLSDNPDFLGPEDPKRKEKEKSIY